MKRAVLQQGHRSVFVYVSLICASDVYLRPAIIGRSGAINAATIVVGIFGGLVVFGAIGLFIGPVVLGGAKLVLDLFARERAAPVADRAGPSSLSIFTPERSTSSNRTTMSTPLHVPTAGVSV